MGGYGDVPENVPRTEVFYRPGCIYMVKATGDILTISRGSVAINGLKFYDFDPKTGTLTLDASKFKPGDLESRMNLKETDSQIGHTVPIQYGDFSTKVSGVRKIAYSEEPMKVEFPRRISIKDIMMSIRKIIR